MSAGHAIPPRTTADALETASARVGEPQGWDFSRVRALRGEAPWDYEDVVAGFAGPSTRLLDIGTGGGEVLERLAPLVDCAVAVDHQAVMVEVARSRLGPDTPVLIADCFALPFAADSFGVVTNRHAQVCITEYARVLEPGGLLIVQQVGGRNNQSIFDAFDWGTNEQQWAATDRPLLPIEALAAGATEAGLEVRRADEYEVEYVFLDLDSLVSHLKAAPFPEPFDPERHLQGVNRLPSGRSARGIETTEHREILVAQKPRPQEPRV